MTAHLKPVSELHEVISIFALLLLHVHHIVGVTQLLWGLSEWVCWSYSLHVNDTNSLYMTRVWNQNQVHIRPAVSLQQRHTVCVCECVYLGCVGLPVLWGFSIDPLAAWGHWLHLCPLVPWTSKVTGWLHFPLSFQSHSPDCISLCPGFYIVFAHKAKILLTAAQWRRHGDNWSWVVSVTQENM